MTESTDPVVNPTRRRSVLIAPGADERKARKALLSNADEVVLDLEDAVTAANKELGRELIRRLLTDVEPTGAVSVRINGLATRWADDDLSLCAELPGLVGVVVPKVELVQDLTYVDAALAKSATRIQALIETPLGVRNVEDIAMSVERLDALIIGYADLGAALGRAPSAPPEQWLPVQDRVLVAARAAGVSAIDGPNLSVANDDAFVHACRWSSQFGFDGKWVIHPGQIDTATSAFTPSDGQIETAKRVLDALEKAESRGSGAAQLDGQMLDEAVALAARRVLAQAVGPSA